LIINYNLMKLQNQNQQIHTENKKFIIQTTLTKQFQKIQFQSEIDLILRGSEYQVFKKIGYQKRKKYYMKINHNEFYKNNI